MNFLVIDTNVLVVANRQSAGVDEACVDACTKAIIEAEQNSVVLLDEDDEVRQEYFRNIGQERPYGLAARFLIHLHQNQYNASHFKKLMLLKNCNGEFACCPQQLIDAGFDRSDRIFAALAKLGNAPVLNATDSDWLDHFPVLKANGIFVHFLCGCEQARKIRK
jgi:hypothetical protein